MKVSDIPKFICHPGYQVNSGWNFIEEQLKQYNDRSLDSWEGLDLNPDFQRGHVWTEDKQIAYVEFCLRGGRSSRTLLFNHPNWQGSYVGQMVLVDGKQRLEAVRKFLRNELPIFGDNCLQDFDSPEILLRGSDAQFIISVNNLKTRREVLQWYLQLNTGGVIHTDEEIEKVQKLLDAEK